MKKCLASLLIFTASAIAADLEGFWSGTLTAGAVKLRIITEVIKADSGAWKGNLESLDQGPGKIPIESVVRRDAAVTFHVPAIQASYEATLSADGSELSGQWNQGGASLPLSLKHSATRPEGALAPAPVEQPITPVDREFLVADLQMSRDALLHSIDGLTEAQWRFKPAPDRWSVAECAEHILREENFLYTVVTERLMKLPARAPASRTPKQQDERIMAKLLDRTQKQVAAEPMRPTGEFSTEAAFRTRFVESRARTIQYAGSTNDDLRGHFTPNAEFGSMDAYQYLLILSGHCARHTAQIEEVKASSNFPKQ